MQEDAIDEAVADYEASPRFGQAEKVALRYSEWMALDPAKIDAAFYERLRHHYSDEDIVELGAFIGFNIGFHTFFGSLKFYPMFAPDGRLVDQEESARIYGETPVSLSTFTSTYRVSGATQDTGARLSAASRSPRQPASLEPASAAAPNPGRTAKGPSGLAIDPLRADEIRDPELKALIERCNELGVPDAAFPRILARAPAHAKAVLRALLFSHTEGNIDHRLKEIIRVKLARIAGDPYFAGLRSKRAKEDGLSEETIEAGCGRFEGDARFGGAERWALRYAHELYRNPENVDAAFYAQGKRYYSEAQIMELGAFIAFHYGMQAFARTLGMAARQQGAAA